MDVANSEPVTEVPPKRPRGRPRISDDEKRRRGTFQLSRARDFVPAKAEEGRIKIEPDPEAKQDYVAVALRYMDDVESGAIITNKWVKLAVARQRRDMERADWEFAFSPFFAAKACAFLEQLPHIEGRWGSVTIHLEPWQCFLVCVLFGWRHRSDSWRRRFTILYLELGRKNAKSTLIAGMALYHLLREDETGAQVICAATTGSQARIVFNIAAQMVRRSGWLRMQGAIPMAHAILCQDGSMKPINAKASSQDGLNPSVIILDESHAQNFQLYNVLKSAQGSRDNSLLLCPTTAGYNLLSVGYSMRSTVQKILQGVFQTEHYLGLIYAIDEGDDWKNELVWPKANPMLGITPKLDKFRQDFIDAEQTPANEPEFRTKALSEWLNSAFTWLPMQKWDACADPSCLLERFVGPECCIGGDLSQNDDIAAVAYSFLIDGLLWACVDMYLPEDVVKERAEKVPELLYWVKAGVLKLTPGNMIDYDMIEADVVANAKRFKVKDAAFDQYGSIQIVGSLFNKHGLPARIENKNASSFTPPSKDLETRVKHHRFRHAGNLALRWQASNVVVDRRVDGSILPKKENAESPNKIDAVDAIIRSISGWIRGAKAVDKQYQMVIIG